MQNKEIGMSNQADNCKNIIANFNNIASEYTINIPIIQRDYVQGREDDKTERIRDKFLDSIYKALRDDKELFLDFIYGNKKESYNGKKIFIPLDGQQRLTTLFLLHLYFSKKSKKNLEYLKNFTYETRSSSREFCNKLVRIAEFECEENTDSIKYKKISENIKNSNWFMPFWQQDPTIKSMLTMLDAIDDKFKNDDYEKFLNRLSNIKFSFLNLENFNLSDDLYIKMNSRRKELTNFENYKAEILEWLKKDENKDFKFKDNSLKNYFSIQIDTKWTDLFWKYRDKNGMIDDKFMCFFENIMQLFYSENLYTKADKKTTADFNILDYKYSKNDIKSVAITLDALCCFEDKNLSFLRKDLSIFSDFIKVKDITYREKVLFYSLMRFFIVSKTSKTKDYSSKNINFKRWMRVCVNIINNTIYNSNDDFIRSIGLINKLSEYVDNIYDGLEEYTNNNQQISDQLKEETIKANMINNNEKWEDKFLEVEKNWYLDGEIGFLIDFSKNDFDDFKKYSETFIKLWDMAKDNKTNQHLIQRALLTYGDRELGYITETKHGQYRYTFCTFGKDVREKNENWRCVFKEEEFKELLDYLKDEKDFNKALESKINEFKFNKDNWKSYLINPKKKWSILSEIRNYQIEFIDSENIKINKGGTGVTSWGWYRVGEFYTTYLYGYLSEKGLDLEYLLSSDNWQKNKTVLQKEGFFKINFIDNDNELKIDFDNGKFFKFKTKDFKQCLKYIEENK